MSENRKIRVFYQFNGYVQGVGFRYRMSHMAGHFGVTGSVRNEYDGSVQIMMRGEEENIDQMIIACQQGSPFSRVDRVSFVVGRWSGFLPPIEDGVFKRF